LRVEAFALRVEGLALRVDRGLGFEGRDLGLEGRGLGLEILALITSLPVPNSILAASVDSTPLEGHVLNIGR